MDRNHLGKSDSETGVRKSPRGEGGRSHRRSTGVVTRVCGVTAAAPQSSQIVLNVWDVCTIGLAM